MKVNSVDDGIRSLERDSVEVRALRLTITENTQGIHDRKEKLQLSSMKRQEGRFKGKNSQPINSRSDAFPRWNVSWMKRTEAKSVSRTDREMISGLGISSLLNAREDKM